MNACTSPMRDGAAGDPQAADDGDEHVLHVAEEHRGRLHQARHELGAERRLVELVVGLPEPGLDLALAPERLDDRVAGERLLDLGVERAGAAPLRDEAGPRPARAMRAWPRSTPAPVVSATSASRARS